LVGRSTRGWDGQKFASIRAHGLGSDLRAQFGHGNCAHESGSRAAQSEDQLSSVSRGCIPCGRPKWDMIVALYMGRLILFQASELREGTTSSELLVVDHF